MGKVVLLINPNAGRGRTVELLPQILKWVKASGLDVEEQYTQRPGHATYLARRAVKEGARIVVAVGGDGTVSEAAAGLVRTEAILAVIPTGTGNDFSRALGLFKQVKLAVETLSNGRPVSIDVGRAGHLTFVNTLGVGFGGDVTHENIRVRRLKGMASYFAAVLSVLPTYKNPTFHLQGRDWEFKSKGLLVEVGNGRFAGGGFKLLPDADLRDGLFDIVLLGDYGPVRRLMALPLILLRQSKRLQDVHYFRSDLVRIAVDRPSFIHVDGNLHHIREPFTVEIMPTALKVLFPVGRTGWQKVE